MENTGDWGIKDANMKDINHDDISIEILDDGGKVACIVCRTFFHLNVNRRLLHYHGNDHMLIPFFMLPKYLSVLLKVLM